MVEDRETRYGLVACDGLHRQTARHAMHQHQRTLNMATVLIRTRPQTPFAEYGAVPVRFYRKSNDLVQDAQIASPVYMTYCPKRSMLRIRCDWTTDDGEPFFRSVSVANLRHYNPGLEYRHVFPAWSGSPDKHFWKTAWAAREPTADTHGTVVPFDC